MYARFTEDSAQLKEKLKDLQSDVAKLRVQVPEKIVQLHEKHLKLLDERFVSTSY